MPTETPAERRARLQRQLQEAHLALAQAVTVGAQEHWRARVHALQEALRP